MSEGILIGEFSKKTGISKRMIRFMDDKKILEPIRCDDQNGYRYYEESQIHTAMNIRILQEYGFSLREIQKIYDEYPRGDEFLELLKNQEVKLRNESDEKISQLLRLKRFIDHTLDHARQITVSNFGEIERSLSMNEERDWKDEVRKLPGEQYMVEFLEEICKTSKNEMTFITFDLDHFLDVNESFGYEVGNRVIERFYCIIEGNFKAREEETILARMGGDEFAIAVVGGEKRLILERIEQVILDTGQWDYTVDGCNKKMTCSCGIASVTNCQHPVELIHESSKALIEAKRMGRNQFRWFEK